MSELKRIVQLANLLIEQRTAVDAAKLALEEATAAMRRTELEDLPELMREIGIFSVTLEDGSTVELSDEVDCGISEERRADAHHWLSENGFGGLIKTEVVVAFGRDEHDQAEEFSAKIVEQTGHTPEVVERVHPATLKSFVKEQLEKGAAIPFDLFGIRPYSKAKIKSKKKK